MLFLGRNIGLARGRTAVILLLLAGLIVAALLIVPLVLNTQVFTDAILHEFEQRTGYKVTTSAMRLRLFPTIGLELSEAQVLERSSNVPVFYATRLEMTLQMLPLLGGRVIGKNLVVERPVITVRRDGAGNWSIIPGANSRPTSSGADTPFALLNVVGNVLVIDGQVLVRDESPTVDRAPLRVGSIQVTVAEEVSARTARIQVSGEVAQGSDIALFNMDSVLVQVQSETNTSEPSRMLSPVQIEGAVRLHRLNLRWMAAWAGFGRVSEGLYGWGQVHAQFKLTPRREGYDLIVSEWKGELSDLAIQGTASLIGLGTNQPRLFATLSAPPLTVRRMLSQIPPAWISAQARQVLTDHDIDGVMTVHSTYVTGAFGQDTSFTIQGSIEVRDGRFSLGENHPVVEGLSARITYDEKQVHMAGLRARYGPVRLTEGEVSITNWKQAPVIDARITGGVPVAGLLALLSQRQESPSVQTILAQIQSPTGEVEVSAHVAGTPASIQSSGLVDADLTIRNAGFRIPDLPVPINQLTAHVKASASTVRLDSLEGRAGPVQISARGSMTLTGGSAYQELTVNAAADARELVSLLAMDGKDALPSSIEGPIRLTAAMTGQARSPRFKGALQLQSAGIHIPNVLTKPVGTPAAIEFDGKLSDDDVLQVRRLELVMPRVRIAGKGWIRLVDDRQFSAKIASEAVSLKKLPSGVTIGPLRAGVLKTALEVRGQGKDRESWDASGQVRFDDGVVTVQGVRDPIENISMVLRFDHQHIEIQRAGFTIGESDMHLSGRIADWAGIPRATVVVESSQIDLRSFRRTGEAPSSPARGRSAQASPWADGSVEATVFVDHLYYDRFLLTGLSFHVNVDQGVLTVDRISGDTNDGHLGGRIVVRAPGRRAGQVQSAFRVSGTPVERILAALDQTRVLNGWLTASGKLQGEFERNGGAILSSVNSSRPIQILIEDGRIFNVPVVSKLLSVMNLPAVLQGQVDLVKDGLPLDRLKGIFSVSNGVIRIKEFLLDSPVLKISGTGRYDFIADDLDLVVVTSPLGSYSALLKNIPVFGKLFAGERQGFDTAIFEVKGPAKDPNIVFLPAESLMAGVKGTAQLAVDLLVNAITLPKEAVSATEELFSGEDDS